MSKKKKLLITGSVSLLGRYIIKELYEKYDIYALTHKTKLPAELSKKVKRSLHGTITKKEDIAKIIESISPDVVIHLAASSNIDYCEKHPNIVKLVNIEGTKNIIASIKDKAFIIFLSTNAIFSGKNPPYKETNQPDPLTVYGQQKHEAERLVLKHKNSLVLRCPTMFGWPPEHARANDLPFYLKKLKQKKSIHAVNDRFFNPIYAQSVAKIIAKALAQKTSGILHVGGTETVSRYLLIKKIANIFSINNHALLIPVSNDYFQHIAPRPYDATLATTKLVKELRFKIDSLDKELATAKREINE